MATLERGNFFGNQSVSANLPTPTQESASEMLNVSPRTIRTIKEIERKSPEKIKEIMNVSGDKKGEVSLNSYFLFFLGGKKLKDTSRIQILQDL